MTNPHYQDALWNLGVEHPIIAYSILKQPSEFTLQRFSRRRIGGERLLKLGEQPPGGRLVELFQIMLD